MVAKGAPAAGRPAAARPARGLRRRCAVLSTAGVLILVYALVNAPIVGWAAARTIAGLAAAAALLTGFAVNEQRRRNPLVPFSIFTITGLAAADTTQVIAQAGFYSMFFCVTVYMQTVLHFSPIAAGAASHPGHHRRRHRLRRLDQDAPARRHPPHHRGPHPARRRRRSTGCRGSPFTAPTRPTSCPSWS